MLSANAQHTASAIFTTGIAAGTPNDAAITPALLLRIFRQIHQICRLPQRQQTVHGSLQIILVTVFSAEHIFHLAL